MLSDGGLTSAASEAEETRSPRIHLATGDGKRSGPTRVGIYGGFGLLVDPQSGVVYFANPPLDHPLRPKRLPASNPTVDSCEGK